MNSLSNETVNIGLVNPKVVMSVAENQKRWQWVNNNDFYKLIPTPYYSFYNNWVRLWLYWYDGYVPWVHGGSSGLLSTNLGSIIVNRASDSVLGENIMFSNARKPLALELKDGKPIGKALNFISNKWSKEVDLYSVLKRGFRYAGAGGFSLLKLNLHNGELWCDTLRADRFYVDKTDSGEIRRVMSVLSFYDEITPNQQNTKHYSLIEERRFETIDMFGKEIPVVEYKMYDTSTSIQYLSIDKDNCVKWENLPKSVRKAFKSEYGCKLNEAQALNGFTDLGVYILNASEDIANVPQIKLGESWLSNILNYLYEYDFWNTCLLTEMYVARGRVMIPKYMQSPNARNSGNQNSGLDDFLYTKIETTNPDALKPEPIQFELRSSQWKETRNILLENISTNVGLSASTIASYLNGASNVTARQVSAEEDATTLFVSAKRRLFTKPINDLLKAVLRFYGYIDDVEIRWSRAGMTNQTVLVDNLTKALNAGLITQEKAYSLYNPDDDEQQVKESVEIIEQAKASQQNAIFGGDFE